jgi:hypothetical protein
MSGWGTVRGGQWVCVSVVSFLQRRGTLFNRKLGNINDRPKLSMIGHPAILTRYKTDGSHSGLANVHPMPIQPSIRRYLHALLLWQSVCVNSAGSCPLLLDAITAINQDKFFSFESLLKDTSSLLKGTCSYFVSIKKLLC